jgi:peroxiredoxin
LIAASYEATSFATTVGVPSVRRPFVFGSQENMMIKVGDKLPAGVLREFIEVEGEGCSIGPNNFEIEKEVAGKTIAVFALPGAFTPTCSAQHVPGFVQKADDFKKDGVDEIWCVSVNDAFVMGAWGRDQQTGGKVRMMGDGSADFTKATGLVFDLTAKGMGVRSQRYSMLVVDGVVKALNIEAPGKFEVSDATTLLTQAQKLKA